MKQLSIAQMIAMMLTAPGLQPHERDFVRIAHEKSDGGRDTSLIDEKALENFLSVFDRYADK